MKIQSIHLKHILHFADLKVDFSYHDKPVTLILGDQASGKTSILRFSYQALTWFAARYKDLRSAGVVMLDHDIMLNRLQSKIDIQVAVPAELYALKPTAVRYCDLQPYSWQLYKTLNQQGIGISRVETLELEQLVNLYQQATLQDPLQGLPLIAYYPAERFVNEMNILSKNNPRFSNMHMPMKFQLFPIPPLRASLSGFVKSAILKMRKLHSFYKRYCISLKACHPIFP